MELSVPVRSAVIWKLTELLCRRRRPGLDLSVTILRPGGGQYFCVCLMRRETWTDAVMMNVAGTSLELKPIHPPRARMEDMPWHRERYQVGILTHGVVQVANDVEALLGLPAWHGTLASTTPPLLGIRLISAVMQRTLFAPQPTLADAGYLDSSAEGTGVQPWVARFPEVRKQVEASRDDWRAAARGASRIWRLCRNGATHGVLLDLATGLALTEGRDEERIQLHREYQRNGRRLAPLVEWIVERTEG